MEPSTPSQWRTRAQSQTAQASLSWQSIKNLILHTPRFLINQRQLSIPTSYGGSNNLLDYIVNSVSSNDDYNLLNITNTVSLIFSDLDHKKKQVLQAVEHYGVPLSEEDKSDFQSFLPTTGSGLQELTQNVGHKIQTDARIIRLFYYDYVQKEIEEKLLFIEIQKSQLIVDLAKLLIAKRKIQPPIRGQFSAVTELAVVLRSMERFDVVQSQFSLNRYFALMDYFIQISDFALTEKLIIEKVSTDFETLMGIMPNSEADIYDQLEIMLTFILKTNKNSILLNTQEKPSEITAAILALFLWKIRDGNRAMGCEKASHFETASKILYQYITLNENTVGRDVVYLDEIIGGVIANKYAGYECLAEFKLHLANGLLVSGRHELFTTSMTEIKRKIDVDIKEYREAFGTELDADAAALFLNSNLISAYLVTTSQKGPVISGIIDGTLPECCKESDDPVLKGLLLMETESRAIGGFYTRTGLVPLGMSFKDFSGRFEEVFKKAKDKYKRTHPEDASKTYSVNLLRILPSEVAFKAVDVDISEKQIPTLMKTVSKLMLDKLNLIENFEFLATLTGEEPKVKLKRVVTTAIDSATSIYSLTKPEIGHIIVSNYELKEIVENKTLDKKLMSKYDCKTLSELAIAVYRTRNSRELVRKGSFEEEFRREIEDIVNAGKREIKQDQILALSKSVSSKLDKYGRILSI
jgi:hypothetical protein